MGESLKQCPCCGSLNLTDIYIIDVSINGTDDPMYTEGCIDIEVVDCLDCGENCINIKGGL